MHMRMRTHPCALATVKMEPDWEIESSVTEMETDDETFVRDASAVPEDRLVKKRNAKAAVWRYFGLETKSYTRKNKACQYQQLARRYLCICAASVPSERVFSAGGNIVTNSLKPARADQHVFLATNLK